ncbi:MAG: ABC transporter permease [Candidatus Gastranaerophilales bacterium]|nr:ABC transporter permease [Candidatus Gastranaerophilales bacterium]
MTQVQAIFKQTWTYKLLKRFNSEFIDWFDTLGHVGKVFLQSIKYILKKDINIKEFFEQSARFGIEALPMTLVMVAITGMIISLQIASEMAKQGAENYVGALIGLAIVRELGPIMGCFSVIAFVGSSMAAEIGTMKVTEQIDAMKVLKIDPIEYLIVPRFLAGAFTMPFVIILANIVGIFGGFITAKTTAEINTLVFIDSVWMGLSIKDVWVSVLKAFIFGGLISLMCTAIGYRTEGGAIDVGKATTKAVVWSFVSMVIADYILSLMFFE